jgi:hypothetical protein
VHREIISVGVIIDVIYKSTRVVKNSAMLKRLKEAKRNSKTSFLEFTFR